MQEHPPAKSEAATATAAVAVTVPTPPRPGKAEKAAKVGRPTTLLDVEEVEWITRELERLLAREKSGGDASADGRHRCRNRAKLSPAAPKKGGFLADLLGRHAVAICCGDDTVESSAAAAAAGIGGRGRRRGGWGSFREVEKV